MSSNKEFDYIVVGAGSAGCAAAYRLAASSDASVLLIESGGGDSSPVYRMPIGFAMLMGEGKGNWNYHTRPEPALDNRQIALPRGRVLGGCSAINGMVYIRGQRQDFDGWAAEGNTGWNYDAVLPLFKRSENYHSGSNSFHGSGGPLEVGTVVKPMSVADAFIEAAVRSGIPRNTDFNGGQQLGVGYYDVNIARGLRHSSARAFLAKQNRPANLTVMTATDVLGIGIRSLRAGSVRCCPRGSPAQAIDLSAREEIILAAGAFNSPKLLELSGIGDAERLRKLGIKPLLDRPAVGENLQDHCNNYLFFATLGAETYYDHIKPLRAPLTLLDFALRRRGIFANPAALVGAFFNLDGTSDRPDAQVHFAAAASRPDQSGKLVPVPGICASICRLQPESRGSSHIQNTDPGTAPHIQNNFLGTDGDRHFQLAAVRKLRDLMTSRPLAELLGEELPPLAGLGSDEQLATGIRQSAESVHHAVGTCRMGIDDEAVVSPDLKVCGIEGLRIADASIMPRIPSGNTHATCVMIGEKLAELVLAARA